VTIGTDIATLARLWLAELDAAGAERARAAPALAGLVPADEVGLMELAAAFQDLFGFLIPPYESLFVDPSAMLGAPATSRLAGRLAAAGWAPPATARVAEPDHIGIELLALAEALDSGRTALAGMLLRDHLALWLPTLVIAIRRSRPHPVYAALAETTLEAVLGQLAPITADGASADPFPDLPPAPEYHGDDGQPRPPRPEPGDDTDPSLNRLVDRLLKPRESGLYLSRQDLAAIARAAELPLAGGGRFQALRGLFEAAGTYDAVPRLLAGLDQVWAEWDEAYATVQVSYPGWEPYGAGWRKRVGLAREWIGLE
jgi:TorA maturation chaperone TorD